MKHPPRKCPGRLYLSCLVACRLHEFIWKQPLTAGSFKNTISCLAKEYEYLSPAYGASLVITPYLQRLYNESNCQDATHRVNRIFLAIPIHIVVSSLWEIFHATGKDTNQNNIIEGKGGLFSHPSAVRQTGYTFRGKYSRRGCSRARTYIGLLCIPSPWGTELASYPSSLGTSR